MGYFMKRQEIRRCSQGRMAKSVRMYRPASIRRALPKPPCHRSPPGTKAMTVNYRGILGSCPEGHFEPSGSVTQVTLSVGLKDFVASLERQARCLSFTESRPPLAVC